MLSCQSAKVKDAKLHKAKPRTEEVWNSKCHWKQFHQQFIWKVISFENRSPTLTADNYVILILVRYFSFGLIKLSNLVLCKVRQVNYVHLEADL